MKRTLIIIGILCIILLPRFLFLMQYPPMIVDEPANVRDIQLLLSPNPPTFFDFEWGFDKALFVQLPSIALIKLGIHDKFLAVRLTSVILSILALLPLYYIIKKLTDKKTATWTTLVFSSSYYVLQFSRVGWTNILTLTLGLYLIWLTLLLIERPSWTYLSLIGVSMGLIFYTYRAGILYILCSFLLMITSLYHNISIKKIIAMFGVCTAIASFIAFPWIWNSIHHWDLYTLRERVVSINNAQIPYHQKTNSTDIYLYQMVTTFQSWFLFLPLYGGGNENQRYLPIGFSPISILFIPFIWLGMLSMKNGKNKNFYIVFFFIYCFGLYFGQIQTVDPPNGARAFMLLPLLYCFAGLGLYRVQKKYIFFQNIFPIYMLLTICTDLAIYIHWMTWIQV